MHLTLTPLLAALSLATTAAADSMTVNTYCFTLACNHNGQFKTDYGTYRVDASDGCRGTSVPSMTEFCVDWKRSRAHFKFKGQKKRCMRETKNEFQTCSGDFQFATCSKSWFTEVKCTW